MTTEEFIQKAKAVHGDKYDYSKVEYVNYRTRLLIICPKHGEFWQRPDIHLQGKGCTKCGRERIGIASSKSKEQFLQEAPDAVYREYGVAQEVALPRGTSAGYTR